ncbi:hypothetical protein AURDEDRAFT_177126 [Auricularia subglabra TFB-10046 SS5]|uniref:Uncharacterized protein n=1 Tax=Auricularia subglabra (strain TFB-10046 / SS5) TaxID=717982 RepID=J0D4W8_AURST|nr:hypothetical protein AURDEDRAFT_177126 [Auricularia subglabra TFB-10046 SS5]
MPLPPSLCDAFYKWALPKLRSLVDARTEDAKGAVKRYGAFHKLREVYLQELEHLPFGQPTYADYLDEDGVVTYELEDIREKASSWFRNHARPGKSVQLAKFESCGGVSERYSTRAKGAAELWAEDEKERIRKSALRALGLPETTGNGALPAEWIGARKAAVTREFALLPQADQDEWHSLARQEKERGDKNQASVISIQERQLGFASWLDNAVRKKIKGGSLGETFVLQFSGYCVRQEDRRLERFRGQVDSGPNPPKWFLSEGYKNIVAPVWTDFVSADVGDKLIFDLPKLTQKATGAAFKEQLENLAFYLEEMFRLACAFETLDVEGFWKDVAADPEKYVSPDRMPEGITFAHPKDLAGDDFYDVYRHVWRCQNKPTAVERDARFIYEDDAVREHVMLLQAACLKEKQQRRAAKARKAAGSGSDAASMSGAAASTSPAPTTTAPPSAAQPGEAANPAVPDPADNGGNATQPTAQSPEVPPISSRSAPASKNATPSQPSPPSTAGARASHAASPAVHEAPAAKRRARGRTSGRPKASGTATKGRKRPSSGDDDDEGNLSAGESQPGKPKARAQAQKAGKKYVG